MARKKNEKDNYFLRSHDNFDGWRHITRRGCVESYALIEFVKDLPNGEVRVGEFDAGNGSVAIFGRVILGDVEHHPGIIQIYELCYLDQLNNSWHCWHLIRMEKSQLVLRFYELKNKS